MCQFYCLHEESPLWGPIASINKMETVVLNCCHFAIANFDRRFYSMKNFLSLILIHSIYAIKFSIYFYKFFFSIHFSHKDQTSWNLVPSRPNSQSDESWQLCKDHSNGQCRILGRCHGIRFSRTVGY